MFRRRLTLLFAFLLSSAFCSYATGDSTSWYLFLEIHGVHQGHDILVGARPGYADGYDGQSVVNVSSGLFMLLHRQQQDPGWPGNTGFYDFDLESPIPAGGSKTWRDIYLWTTDSSYLAVPDRASLHPFLDLYRPPEGYWGKLVLDHVPVGLNWSGPMSFAWDLNTGLGEPTLLPVPTVSDGVLGTHMHLTVYTYPIPEPSSLLALAGALMGLGGLALRGRWK